VKCPKPRGVMPQWGGFDARWSSGALFRSSCSVAAPDTPQAAR
jgi:hypothetical protein